MAHSEVIVGLPKTLKIGHLKYRVEIVPEGTLADAFGETDNERQIIRLDRSMTTDRAREIVLHEILHAIWSVQDLGHRAAEENAVTSLARGITMVLASNAGLRKWFARELCHGKGNRK